MKYKEIILILLFLIFTLQSSFAQINTTTTSIDKLENTTPTVGGIIIEDSIVGEKLEQVQNQSNATGNPIEDPRQKK